jgi:site-specific recombinase XerD
LKEAGLPDVRFHDLRHRTAPVLIAAKVDLKAMSDLLGHSLVAITVDVYQSVLPVGINLVLCKPTYEVVSRFVSFIGYTMCYN